MALSRADKDALARYLDWLRQIKENGAAVGDESPEVQKARKERAQKDYAYFVSTYFPHIAGCECAPFHIEEANRVKRDPYYKGVQEWGRGLAKSTHFNVMIPLWLKICGELKVMVLVGKSQKEANRLISDLQAEFEANELFRHDWGDMVNAGNWEEGNFATKDNCAFFALGRGQSPRGIKYRGTRPDYIVADDIDDDVLIKNPVRVREITQWVLKALMGTMDIGRARFVLVNNRIGTETILTSLLRRKGFKHRKVNVLQDDGEPSWPQKYTKEYYEDIRGRGEIEFQTEFMNNPIIQGTIFKEEQIDWVKLPRIDSFDAIVGHWDVAYSASPTADYNAIKIWGIKDGHFYMIDGFVRHCRMKDAIEWIYARNKDFEKKGIQVRWVYESQFWNEAVERDIQEVADKYDKKYILIKGERPIKNKFDRILRMQPYYQQGRIHYNRKKRDSPDIQTGLAQLYAIEPGYKTHDDSPDTDEGAIKELERFASIGSSLPVLGPKYKSNRLF